MSGNWQVSKHHQLATLCPGPAPQSGHTFPPIFPKVPNLKHDLATLAPCSSSLLLTLSLIAHIHSPLSAGEGIKRRGKTRRQRGQIGAIFATQCASLATLPDALPAGQNNFPRMTGQIFSFRAQGGKIIKVDQSSKKRPSLSFLPLQFNFLPATGINSETGGRRRSALLSFSPVIRCRFESPLLTALTSQSARRSRAQWLTIRGKEPHAT